MSDVALVDNPTVYEGKLSVEERLDRSWGVLVNFHNKDNVTPAEMEALLVQDGVKFHDKNRMKIIPKFDQSVLQDKVSAKAAPQIMVAVGALNDYLNDQVITDQWGDDHESRRLWRSLYNSQKSEHFSEAFEKIMGHNQLKRNRLFGVTGNVDKIRFFLKKYGSEDESIISRCQDFMTEFGSQIKGEAYDKLPDEEKIQLVRNIEDEVVSLLNSLFAGSDELVSTMVT